MPLDLNDSIEYAGGAKVQGQAVPNPAPEKVTWVDMGLIMQWLNFLRVKAKDLFAALEDKADLVNGRLSPDVLPKAVLQYYSLRVDGSDAPVLDGDGNLQYDFDMDAFKADFDGTTTPSAGLVSPTVSPTV